MRLPFVCDGASLVFLQPTLGFGWSLAGIGLVVLAALAAIAASLAAPVAGALSGAEGRVPRGASLTFVVFSAASCVAVFAGLLFTLFPLGCSTHAVLVSAAIPEAATPIDEQARISLVADAAEPAGRLVRDLSTIRDAALLQLSPYAETELDAEVVASIIRRTLAQAMRRGLPAPQSGGAEAAAIFDPAFVETVEIALLMGWRALYSGPSQRLTYIVSDRAERHSSWRWRVFARSYFPSEGGAEMLSIDVLRAGNGKLPLLSQVLGASVHMQPASLVTEVLIAANQGGTIVLEAFGSGIAAEAQVTVPAGIGAAYLTAVTFAGVSEPERLIAVRQRASSGAILVSRRLPPRRPYTVRLSLPGAASTLKATLGALAGEQTCEGASDDAAAQLPGWRNSFAHRQDAAPLVVESSEDQAEVALHLDSDGSLLIIPLAALQGPALTLEARHRLGVAYPATVPASGPADRFILWEMDSVFQRYDLHRFGVPPNVMRVARVINPERSTTMTETIAVSYGYLAETIAGRRLALDANARKVGPAVLRLTIDDPVQPALRHRATLFALGPKALQLTCDQPVIEETELFLAYWKAVLDAVAVAAVPIPTLSPIETVPSQTAPTIVLDRTMLSRIASARIELPLQLVAAAIVIFMTYVCLSYVNAIRVFR